MITAIERPELTFGIFGVDTRGRRLLVSQTRKFFGKEDYDLYRYYGKMGEFPPEEIRQRTDREIYAKVGSYTVDWAEALAQSNRTVRYAHGIYFPDQEKRATLVTTIAWSDNRPSTALRILTTPTHYIGAQCKYEQGRQLGLALLCAEVMSRDENGRARSILSAFGQFLEKNLFVGKEGDPENYHVFSYHSPGTNSLLGLSQSFPDSNFPAGSWVKSLDFPVRNLKIIDSSGEVTGAVRALYDPREKEVESAVIKAKERSLQALRTGLKGDVIETSPYGSDQLGAQFVVMEGGRSMRDLVTSTLEQLFRKFEGTRKIVKDDQVDENHGSPTRIEFRRRLVFLEGLDNPLEIIIYALEDWIPSEYEAGTYKDQMGMHDGRAHDLYKLNMVGNIAEYLWPFQVYGLNLKDAKKASSYDYAARLGVKQRIHPSPYIEAA